MKEPEKLRAEILRLAREYAALAHGQHGPGAAPAAAAAYAGRVFDADEVEAAVGSALDFWLTLGPQGEEFERRLAEFLGVGHSLLVNSGSSANLLAVAALTSPHIPAPRRLLPGDEIITVAAGFPTTVAPMVQNGAVPVFIDSDPATGNARPELLEAALRPGKTKAVMMAHTLGNPFDVAAVLEFCRRHGLWLIEDNCDALGSTYAMPVARARELGLGRLLAAAESAGPAGRLPAIRDGRLVAYTGSWGDLSTQSFYPAHQITTGEGGAVNVASDPVLKSCVESLRSWGRDCWCATGRSNTCGKRFAWRWEELPDGYDHKYVYSHLGYNLKPLDLQAAIGLQQLKKLPAFVAARRRNWEQWRAGLDGLGEFFEFTLPTHAAAWTPQGFSWGGAGERVDCSWFGFSLRVRAEAPFSRCDLAVRLDQAEVGNRMLFGGNLLRQPGFIGLRRERPEAVRVAGSLAGADELMERALFVGTYPGLSPAALDRAIGVVQKFARSGQ